MKIVNDSISFDLKLTTEEKDNALSWFDIVAQKGATTEGVIFSTERIGIKGTETAYTASTPLIVATYGMLNNQRQEPLLAKLTTATNNDKRVVCWIVGNRQIKAMQDTGTIRDIFLNPIAQYNVIGLCGRKSTQLNNNTTSTYEDAHGNNRYYWQDYGEVATGEKAGFKWSIKALLGEFYIKIADTLEDKYIYTPSADFPRSTTTTAHRVTTSYDQETKGYTLKNTFTHISTIPTLTDVSSIKTWRFRNYNTGQPSARTFVDMVGVNIGYDLTLTFNNNDTNTSTLCLLRYGRTLYDELTTDDYIGGYGVVTEVDADTGERTLKFSGTALTGREIEIKSTDTFFVIDIYLLRELLRLRDTETADIIPTMMAQGVNYRFNVLNSPYYTTNIYNYTPKLDVLTIIRLYQYMLNTDIEINKNNVYPTELQPTDTTKRYYQILSYTQKWDNFSLYKAKKNYIKITKDEDEDEDTLILDCNLTGANVLELDEEAEIVTLPSKRNWDYTSTHSVKTFTRCYEALIKINYADYKTKLNYISFFGQKARVAEATYNENDTAKVVLLL